MDIGRAFFNGASEFAATDAHPRPRERNIKGDARLLFASRINNTMKPGKFTHTIAVMLSSITSLFAHGTDSKAEPAKTKFSKKSEKSAEDRSFDVSSLAFTPGQLAEDRLNRDNVIPWKNRHRDDHLLDRRETGRQQSSPKSRELVGHGMDKKLWRD